MPLLNPIDDKKFSIFTESILNKLPYWFSIKKRSQKSIGAAFLNVFGLELEDIDFILNYAFKQCFIQYTDIEQIDIVYRASLNGSLKINDITDIKTSIGSLTKADTLPIFNGSQIENLKNQTTNDKSYYFIDLQRKILYVHEPYDINNKYEDGKVTIVYKDGTTITLPLKLYHVWNYFDEFGFLLDCPRLYGEKNYNYKTRILDVFKNIANSTKTGLLNGIARELNLRKVIVWEDGYQNLIITDPMLAVNKIKINGELIPLSEVFVNEKNQIVLKGSEEYRKIPRVVTYTYGVEIHHLDNQNDTAMYNEIFNIDGTATNKLLYYTNKISEVCKIEWNKFIWNESYYDVNKEDVGGLAFIPTLYDGNIEGFKKYK